MKKKFLIFLCIFLFLSLFAFFLFFNFYSKRVLTYFDIKYFSPDTVNDRENFPYGKIDFYFNYPITENYFLKNISFYPEIKGSFSFDGEVISFFKIKAYKKITFIPHQIERDKAYKIKFFKKEFTFSLPSPKTKMVLYNKKEKRLEIEFYEPIEEDYFFEVFQLKPKPKGKYIFLNENKKVLFLPEQNEKDIEYKGKLLDKDFSFVVEVPKITNIYFDKEKKEVIATISEPVSESQIFNKIEIEPKIDFSVSFDEGNTKVILRFKDLKKDVYYKLKVLNKEFSFIDVSLRVKNIYFDSAKRQVVIVFNTQIEEEAFLKEFKIEPEINGKFIFAPDKTWVVFQPSKLEEEKLYTVTILGAKLSFKIPKPKPLPQITSGGDKYIDIDLSSQTLRLYQNGKVIATYLISSGRPGMETPTGTFRVLSKHRLLWSSQYGLYMPYSLQFYNGYFIHELPYWPGGYREGENHLGIPVSHGCVRLGVGAAKVVYDFADIGTKIIIHK